MEAIQLDQVLRGSLTGETQDTIIVPVNLGNNISQEEQGHHWAALYIRFSSENRLKPFIGYYDPLGKPMPSNLKDRLCCVYKEIDPNSDIFSCPEKMQSDGYNCGPWVIFILNHLIDPKTRDFLPSLGFDIQQAKIQYRGILNNT